MSGDDLRSIRDRLGMTNPGIAEVLGVREDTVKKWVAKKDPIPYRVPSELAAYAEHLSDEAQDVARDLKDFLSESLDWIGSP